MKITPRIAAEILAHEAIVLEAYKDSVGVWTWGVGVTSASGHKVERYIDKPQTVDHVLEIFVWLLEEKYAPSVRKAFKGIQLTEEQFGAALSFHYNTGSIGKASWVKSFVSGDIRGAKTAFMNWQKPKEIIPRRKGERDLFFDGKWAGNGTTTIFGVRKPSYQPNWGDATAHNCMAPLERLLSPSDEGLLPPPADHVPVYPKPRRSLLQIIRDKFQ